MLQGGSGARAQTAQIASLSDVTFGTVPSVTANRSIAQTLCVFSSLRPYTIRATGSGTGGAFTLASPGAAPLPYTVQWSFSGGQTAGLDLTANTGRSGTPATLDILCGLNLLSSNASLIITLPASSLSAAQAGTYNGTLSLMVSPN